MTNFTYSSSPQSVCTISGSAVTLLAVGACMLTAHQAGGTYNGVLYSAADSPVATIQVTAGQTITFTPPTSVVLSAHTLDLSTSASSSVGLTPFTYTSSTSGVCTVSGSTVTLLAVGACKLTAHQAGGTYNNAYYTAADSPVATVQVTASQTISFSPPSSIPLTTGTFSLSASSDSGLGGFTFSSSTTGVCTVSGSTVTLVSAGACTLTAHQAGGTQSGVTYAAADSSPQTVTIIGAQTITFTPPASVSFGAQPLDLSSSATSSALLTTFTYSSSTSGVCTVSGSTVTLVAVGACKLTAHQAGGTVGGVTYAAADSSEVTVQVTVGQTITFTPPASVAFSAGTLDLSNSASSSVPALNTFTYSSSTSGVCTVSGSTVTLVTAGNCKLTAHQAGGAVGGVTYAAVDSTEQTVTVMATQTITFNPPSTEPFTAGTFTLSANASSTLTSFTYSSSTQACARSAATRSRWWPRAPAS